MAVQIVKEGKTKKPADKPVKGAVPAASEKTLKPAKQKSAQASSAELIQPEVVSTYLEKRAELKKKQEKLEPLGKEVSDLEKQLRAAVDESGRPDDEKVLLVGTDPSEKVEFSAKGSRTTITDKAKLIELIGQEQFNELADISITAARQYLTPKQIDLCMTTELSTARRLKVLED